MTDPVSPLPRRYTVEGAAELLGLSVDSVRREIGARRLGCYRLGPGGRILRVGEHHLAAYLEGCNHPCRATDSPSATPTSAPTGSAAGATAGSGAGPGSTP